MADRESDFDRVSGSIDWQRLAAALPKIRGGDSPEEILHVVTEEVRGALNVHQAISSLTTDDHWSQAHCTVALSPEYDERQDCDIRPIVSGIHARVCRSNRSVRMTQVELEALPEWIALNRRSIPQPAPRGWSAAPLVSREGRNLGLIQVMNKIGGEFTAEDDAALALAASATSAALENAELRADRLAAAEREDHFIALLAHELRNPLAPLRSGLELLTVMRTAPEIVNLMQRQVEGLARLIDDLMEVLRMRRDGLELHKGAIELASVVRRGVDSALPLIEANHHEFQLDLPDEPIHLFGDSARLAQVISNLLNNAAKFSPSGGLVRLSARRDEDDVVISIRDTGIGIDRTFLPHVFDLFRRPERALDRPHGGLGIGLTIVKNLVEMHDGSVTAKSEGIGKGSEFSLRLPILNESILPEEASPARLNDRSFRVLVVDDNMPAAKMLALLLKKTGSHAVAVAHDGKQALAMCRLERPDVVLLDIGLPGLSGYEVAKRMREMPELAETLMVALTGYGTEDDRRRSLENGFDEHLVKPPALDALRKLFAHPKLACRN